MNYLTKFDNAEEYYLFIESAGTECIPNVSKVMNEDGGGTKDSVLSFLNGDCTSVAGTHIQLFINDDLRFVNGEISCVAKVGGTSFNLKTLEVSTYNGKPAYFTRLWSGSSLIQLYYGGLYIYHDATKPRNIGIYATRIHDSGDGTVTDDATDNVQSITLFWEEPEYEVKFNPQGEGQYLWMYALNNGEISFTIPAQNHTGNIPYISWSKNDGQTWETVQNQDGAAVTATIDVDIHDKVIFKSECVSGTNWNTAGSEASSYPARFSSTCPVNVGGNIASLMYGDNFHGVTTAKTNATHMFFRLFAGMDVIHASSLYLPFMTMKTGMYQKMFENCQKLINGPKVLPAKTLSSQAYHTMFKGCTSLMETPAIMAMTPGPQCMRYMFSACTSLPSAAFLNFTSMAASACEGTYIGCTSLTEARVPTTKSLAGGNNCYRQMFSQCTSLEDMPELPATTLSNSCYYLMFQACHSLINTGTLPATTLVSHCYRQMFQGCTSLTYIKAMFTTTPSTNYTSAWTLNCPNTTACTFVKNTAATWNVRTVHGIPSNWTVETAAS